MNDPPTYYKHATYVHTLLTLTSLLSFAVFFWSGGGVWDHLCRWWLCVGGGQGTTKILVGRVNLSVGLRVGSKSDCMKYTGFYIVKLLNVDTLKSGHPPAKLISTYLVRASQLYFILAKLLGFTFGNREGISTYNSTRDGCLLFSCICVQSAQVRLVSIKRRGSLGSMNNLVSHAVHVVYLTPIQNVKDRNLTLGIKGGN